MRSIKTIKQAEEKFYERVWLERHIVSKEWSNWMNEYLESGDENKINIVKDALKAEEDIKEKYKNDSDFITPCTDYEWGMINGKLSALRWVLGSDWDELYT